MHSLEERANLVRLHSRAQGLATAETTRVLSRITSLEDGPAGWSTVWSREGERYRVRGDRTGAIARFNLARFPFPHTPDGHAALQRCISLAGDLAVQRGVTRIEVDGWAAWHLPAPDVVANPRLLVVCGGIVSIKEQWLSLLELGRRWSMAVLLTEFPGVGENTTTYNADTAQRFSTVLDAAASLQRFESAFALALSFGGTIALRASGDDPRIGSILSVGPPIRNFFTDRQWWDQVPQTTKDALVVTTRTTAETLADTLVKFALTADQLAAVKVPVTAIASLRDEIVPVADLVLLRSAAPKARIVAFDDVHGSPCHLLDTRLLTIGALAEFIVPRRPIVSFITHAALRLRRSERPLT
ncbi:alpha/beta fold hydrolase [Mycobacterium montefiorense]|nr:alpha/beta fold hydrolase [Mycobacterium montefiorense]